MFKSLAVLGVMLVVLGLLALKAPHIRLAGELASGTIDGRAVPVIEVSPARFAGPTVAIRCGDLVLEVPRGSLIESEPVEDSEHFTVSVDGLKCGGLRPHRWSSTDLLGLNNWGVPQGPDEISRQAAVCAASSRDFSFWMNPDEVEQLHYRLERRPAFCFNADEVDVIRGPGLGGLLLYWTSNGRPRFIFEYFSADGLTRGCLVMSGETQSDQVIATARAIAAGCRLEPQEQAMPPGLLASRE
jgi:hypothetical protein